MEKTADEVREGFKKREVMFKVDYAAYLGGSAIYFGSWRVLRTTVTISV